MKLLLFFCYEVYEEYGLRSDYRDIRMLETFCIEYYQGLEQRFSTLFNSRHTEQGAKTVKAHHRVSLRREFINKNEY